MESPNFFLKDAYLFWPEWKRFFYRIFFQVFVFLGLLISILFALLKINKYFYLDILLVLFFVFIAIRKNFSDLAITDDNLKKKNINLALFLSPQAKDILVESFRFSKNKKISLPLACLYILCTKPEIINSLRYLDFTSKKIIEIQQKILEERGSNNISEKEFFLILSKNALVEAQQLKQNSLNAYSLMLGLYSLNDEQLLHLLDFFGLEKNDLIIAFSINILAKQRNIAPIKGLSEIKQPRFLFKKPHISKSLTSRPTPLLDALGVDFTDLARQLRIGIMIGHLKEYESLIRILSRIDKRNVLLIGPAGIGKDTIISYLAYNLIRNNVPLSLRDYRLINLDFSSLFKDTQTPFEAYNRLTKIVNEVLDNRDIILYLPQLHNYKLLIQEGGLSALEILRPLFELGQIPVIATTTPEDFHRYLELDSSIQNYFEIIRVKEVSPQEAIKILAFESLRWEKETKIRVSFKAIKRAVILAQQFLAKTPLPSSAESLLTEALEGAKQKRSNLVTEYDIVDLVSIKTNVPLETSQLEERQKLLSLEQIIHQFLIDQEEAVKLVSSALRQYRAGLANPNKPIGVFLFVGPTGVGKTELSKILARIYFGSEKSMIRFDMSEYQDPKSIFRFIGSPDQEISGTLTEAVKEKPFSLILLDEFEKAHSKVLDLFLPLFDEGRLTDNLGETIDFTNTIIIATSNALSDFIKDQIEKGKPFEQLVAELKHKLTDYFKPELLNRFDEIVIFKPLTLENLKDIVKLKLKNVVQILEKKKIEIEFEDLVIEKLAQLGYNPIFGARPLDAVIRHFIKDSLAQAILTEQIKPNSKVHFIYRDNKFIPLIKE